MQIHDPKLPQLSSEDFEIKVRKPKILLWDVETAPIIGAVWQRYETNLVWTETDWFMMAWSCKWLDGKQITRALPDYEGYRDNPGCDRELITELWKLLDSADVLIAHNGDRFDLRKANARFLVHGLLPPQPVRTIDTLKVSRKHFHHTSNKLDDLGQILGVGRKVKTGGYDLWKDCLAGDQKAWNRMKKYCAGDVRLLEKVYLKLRPWIMNHPNMAILQGKVYGCRNCGSVNLIKRANWLTKTGFSQQYQCQEVGCGTYMTAKHQKKIDIT